MCVCVCLCVQVNDKGVGSVRVIFLHEDIYFINSDGQHWREEKHKGNNLFTTKFSGASVP